MNSYEQLMFHKAYPLDSFFEEAKVMEREKELMLSYLPEKYGRMQRQIEETCDSMEYDGSRMYDVHPDKEMIRQLVKKILEQLKKEDEEWDNKEDIVSCFLCNEIFRRRYRTWKSKQYIR